MNDFQLDQTVDPSEPKRVGNLKPLRLWPLLVLLLLMALMGLVPRMIGGASDSVQMFAAMGLPACGILILLWWLLLSRATLMERCVGLVGVGVVFALAVSVLDKSMVMPGMLLVTIPMGTVAFAIGAILFARTLSFKRTIVAVMFAACGFGFSDLLRSDGMWGGIVALDWDWRWNASAEEQMLAQRNDRPVGDHVEFTAGEIDNWLTDSQWPGFRGADRTSRQQGPQISTDWSNSPPEQIWKIPVGPGWSSFAVAGNLLFTQEQRGPLETIVCYAADTGREIWTQQVKTRFYESMGGVGPRATPTLADGALFVMGANGDLLRLDPKTGNIDWQVNLQEFAKRKPPMWGFSSSPLVVNDNVIVHAGGEGDNGTLAFSVNTGELNWSAASGDHSYSSPQLGTIANEEFVLMLTNTGLDLLNPQTGEIRLFYPWEFQAYRALQPQVVDGNSVLLPTGMGEGTRRIRITNSEGKLSAEEIWTSRQLKPDFNDFVIYQNHCYGFDGAIFTCIDLTTGKRTWKAGRYGKGQVLLLANSAALLVACEQGDIVLLAADPDKHTELSTFPTLDGKTWNHPVVVGDRLYIRNAQEAGCFRLPLVKEVAFDNINTEQSNLQ